LFSGISKKVIFLSILFINFFQPSKSAEFAKINKNINNQNTKFLWSNSLNEKILSISSKSLNDKNSYVNLLKKNFDSFLLAKAEKQQELIIQSDKQSEINNIIYAEGNVSVSFGDKLLRADNLIYDKSNKKINATGNIVLILGDQLFKVSQLEYSFISEKGYLLNVKGIINTNNLIDDLSLNFSLSDSKNIENLLELKKKEVSNTPGKVENWLFFTDKISIDGQKWESKKAVFSNDLLESKQVKLAINSLKVISEAEKLKFKSSINYLIFEEKVSIPIWLGDRTLTKSGKFLDFENRWNSGYENLDKDGYFIGRKFNSIDINDDFVLDGELLVWNFKEQIAFDFSLLQKRINRRSPTRSIQIKYPIIFIAYDLLEINGRDIREIKLENRRIELEKYFSKWQNKTENNISDIFKICDLIFPNDWPDALTYKEKSRENNTEGLIIKKKTSTYSSGRKKGIWWKYKVDPMQLDAVLIYAKGGSGRRAGLYTDYSFALWKDEELIKFASAYSGLTNIEIKELDKWIRKNTIEKFGPVRSLKPEMVFEISFEKIQISKRHKSGIAVRFPRITKWRKDKKINDADSLENAYELMKKKL